METPKSDQSKWCDLPYDVLHLISRHLNRTTDLPRLRAIYPAWRSALPRPILNRIPQVPTLPAAAAAGDHIFPPVLIQSRFYFLSPLAGDGDGGGLGGRWLARMVEEGPNNQWHLFNPLTVSNYFSSQPPLTASLNLLDCRVLELAAPFSLLDGGGYPISKKVVGGGWDADSAYQFALLFELEIDHGSMLLLWRLGDKEWTIVDGDHALDLDLEILDIAFLNGRFYVFDLTDWQVLVIDPYGASNAMEFIPAPDILGNGPYYTVKFHGRSRMVQGSHLVPSNGQLYMVIELTNRFSSDNDNDNKIKDVLMVFVLNDKEGQSSSCCWEQVDNLGDQIFFIGNDVAFALPTSSVNLLQWKPNSICLFSAQFTPYFESYDDCVSDEASKGSDEYLDSLHSYRKSFRIFDMEEGEENGVVGFRRLSKEVYTGLFFPPPAWVQWQLP